MHKTRLEAFSDAVIAILLTLMALELGVPHGETWRDLLPLVPVFLAYVMSFVYLAIYWNNHHHMLQATDHVDGRILWANMHLLFWLSLIPFATNWLSESHFAKFPVAAYGAVLLFAGFAYFLLSRAIVAHKDTNHVLREAIGRDWKGKVSILFYLVAIPMAYVDTKMAVGIFLFVALIWFLPDRRIERKIVHRH